jgi:phosphate transport system protein
MDETSIEEILNTDIKSKSSDAIDNIIGEMKHNSKTVVSGTNLLLH